MYIASGRRVKQFPRKLRGSQRLDRVWHLDEAVLDAEPLGDQLAEPADPEGLGGVVAGGDEVDAVLARRSPVAGSLGSPVISASRPSPAASSSVEAPPPETIPTRRISAGPDSKTSGSRPVSFGDARRKAPRRRDRSRGGGRSRRPAGRSTSPKRTGALEPEPLADQGVVADLGVSVERQVICRRPRSRRRATVRSRSASAGERPRAAVPEQPVVDDDELGPPVRRRPQQLEIGRDAGDHPLDLLARPGTWRPFGP